MARIEDLNLSSRPLDEESDRFCQRIKALLLDDAALFAHDTLEDILASVERDKKVTPGRVEAIDNIEAAADRNAARETRERSYGSRRWEGFGGRSR